MKKQVSEIAKKKFFLYFFLVLFSVLLSIDAQAQNTYIWKGVPGASWTTASNWTPARIAPANNDIIVFHNSGTTIVADIPTQTIGQLFVTGNTDVTLMATATNTINIVGSADVVNFFIEEGATLQIPDVNALTIIMPTTHLQKADISGTLEVRGGTFRTYSTTSVYGLFTVSSTGVINHYGGTITANANSFKFSEGSNYNYLSDGGVTIPTATWEAGSNINILGIVNSTSIAGGLNQSFGNFNYNCKDQDAIDFGLGVSIIAKGNFEINNTGLGSLHFKNSTSALILTVNGVFMMKEGSFIVNSGTSGATTLNFGALEISDGVFDLSTGGGTVTLTINGDYKQTGGVFTQTSAIASNCKFGGVESSFLITGGTYNNATLSYEVISSVVLTLNSNIITAASKTFLINPGATLILGDGTLASAATSGGLITNSGSLYFNGNIITGSGGFTNTSAAATFLFIDHSGGIAASTTANGNIQVTGTRTFGVAANYIYNGTTPQVTGSGLPTANITGTLTIDNPTSVSLSSSHTLSNSSIPLYLNQGLLILGNNNLTLSNANASIGGNTTSASNMIVTNGTGQLVKAFSAGTPSFTFPIGDNTGDIEYTPFAISFTTNSVARSIGARIVNSAHTKKTSSSNYLNRYWALTNSNTSGTYSYDMEFDYSNSDIVGSVSSMVPKRWNGSAWTNYSGSLANNKINFSNLTHNVLPLSGTIEITADEGSVYYYRSKANGNWTSLSTWEVDTDPNFSNPQNASAAPTASNSAKVIIDSGTKVTVSANVTAINIEVDGTLESTITNPFAGVTSQMNFNSGSVYEHNVNGGYLPLLTAPAVLSWDANSTVKIVGITTATLIYNIAQTFGNLEYNSPSQTSNFPLNISGSGTSFKGNFIVKSTGSGIVRLKHATTATNIYIDGNLEIENGSLIVNAGATAGTNLYIGGDYIQTGGTFNLSSVNIACVVYLDGNYTQTGGTFDRTVGATVTTFYFRGVNKEYKQTSGTVNNKFINYVVLANAIITLQSDLELSSSRSFTVNASARLNFGTKIISGAGSTFTLASNGTIDIGHQEGIVASGNSGNIQTATRTLNAGGHYIYSGTSEQVTGSGLPATVSGTLTIDNPTSVSLSNNYTLSNASIPLYLNQGLLILGDYDLTFNQGTASIGGNDFSANNMIVADGNGRLLKAFATGASSFTFPIGDASSNYSPISMQFAANSKARNIGFRLTNSKHPNDIVTSDFVSRYWTMTSTAADGTYNLNIDFTYSAGDKNGTESSYKINRYDNVNDVWIEYNSEVNPPVVSAQGILHGTSFIQTSAEYTLRSNPTHLCYRSKQSGNWNDISIWEVSSDPDFISPAPIQALSIPTTTNSDRILIDNGHTVTITSNVVADDIVVDGTLQINGGTTFSVANGEAEDDMIVNGSIINEGSLSVSANAIATINGDIDNKSGITLASSSKMIVNGTLSNNTSTTSINSAAASLFFEKDSYYIHNRDGGVIPTASWHKESNMKVVCLVATAITGQKQVFGNIIWDNSYQTMDYTFAYTGSATICSGNFILNNTGSGAVIFKNGTSATTLTIGGDLQINEGHLIVNAGGTSTTTGTNLYIGGDYLQTGGTLDLSSSNATCTFNLDGNYYQTGGTFTRTIGTYITTFNFRGANKEYKQTSGTVNNTYINYVVLANAITTLQSDLALSSGRAFTVNASARLNFGTKIISGASSTFTLAANGTIDIGHQDGIVTSAGGNNGNIQTATRTLNLAGHYIYSGTDGQVTGSALATGITGSITVNLSDGGELTLINAGASTIAKNGRLIIMKGSLANTASFVNDVTTLEYAGSQAQTTNSKEFPTTNGPRHLVINNSHSDGVILHEARTMHTSGILALTNGTLNTTATNLLTVAYAATGAVVGGSETSYVKGPLERRIPSASSGTYSFPVGKNAYAGFDVTLGAATGAIFTAQAEYFEEASGGSAGDGLSSIEDRYWHIQKTSGTGKFNDILLTITADGINEDSKIGYSDTKTASYSNIGGELMNNSVTSILLSSMISEAFYTIGSVGEGLKGAITKYNNLTEIANALRTNLITGDVIFELPSTYAGEPALPVVFNEFAANDTAWEITIRPALGSTNFLTAGDPGSGLPLIDLDGIDRLTIDGRPGGEGASIEWIFRNTRTASTVGSTFRFINDATYNNLTYLNIQGQNTTATSGTILFSTSVGLVFGNSNNTISYCDIRDRSDANGKPTNAVYSNGTTSIRNANNIITNNHIYNISPSHASSGIHLAGHNAAWTITNNHIYQTSSQTGSGHVRCGIKIANTQALSDNFIIKNNYIGGSQPFAQGDPWTLTGTVNQSFYGIYLQTLAAATNNVIEDNVIGNLELGHGTSKNDFLFVGIYDVNGNNLIKGNTIGSTDGSRPIKINSALATASVTYGIYLTLGNDTVLNNIIGDISLTNATGIVGFTGIYTASSSASPTITIDGNTIANISASYTGTTVGGFVRGIHALGTTAAGIRNITNNNIYNLNSATGYTGVGTNSPAIGILQLSTVAGHTITGNTVHSITNTHPTTATHVAGIFYNGATTGTNRIERNFVHSLALSTNNTSSTITGVYVNSGLVSVANNMIRLGITPEGESNSGNYTIRGFYHIPKDANSNYYFNTVYIGGSVSSSSNNTYCINRTAASGAIYLFNNIFYNTRSNVSGTGKHFAIGFTNMTGLISDYNFFNTDGVGGNIGEEGTTVYSILPEWINATNNPDINSSHGTLNFVNATDEASKADLHIDPSGGSQIESVGIAVAGYNTDYDGDLRFSAPDYQGSGTSVDIGADEIESISLDLTPPLISYFPIEMQNTLIAPSLSVAVVDAGSDVSTAQGKVPRLYYKRSTDANIYIDNTSATDGWKWVEAVVGSISFDFEIDYTKLKDGFVIGFETIEYFVVAQDEGPSVPSLPNVGINSGIFKTAPLNGVDLDSTVFPISGIINSYYINVIYGEVTVGTSGATYNSLTNDGGLFENINTGRLSDDLIVTIISDLTDETGTHALNEWLEMGAGGYIVSIKPDDQSRLVSGSVENALIRLDGADRVTIDGGTNKNLTISNSVNGAYPAISLINGATYNKITNLNLKSRANNGTLLFGVSSESVGNSYNEVSNCEFSPSTTTAPSYGIYSSGTNANPNSNNVIKGNEIKNFRTAGIYANGTGCGNTWLIGGDSLGDGNKIYNEVASGATRGIYIGKGGEHTIKHNSIYQISGALTGSLFYGIEIAGNGNANIVINNFIGGSEPYCLGDSPLEYKYISNTNNFRGITLAVGSATASEVHSNMISNISITNTHASYTTTFMGIAVTAGLANIGSDGANIIGHSEKANSIVDISSVASTSYGISVAAGSNPAVIENNIIANIKYTGGGSSFQGISCTAGTTIASQINNNKIKSIKLEGTGSATFTGINIGGGMFEVGTSAGNIIGDLDSTNSIVVAGTSVSYGINSTASVASDISNNIIANICATSTGTGVYMRGIYHSNNSTQMTINNNTIKNLSSASQAAGVQENSSVLGIYMGSTTATGHSISGNKVFGLANTNSVTIAAVNVTGIVYAGATTGVHNISRNFVHSLSSLAQGSAVITGILVKSGIANVHNNMIRLGIDSEGSSVAGNYSIIGLSHIPITVNSAYYYNSVYIGGTVSSSSTNTFAYYRSAASGVITLRNNIFDNSRSNGSGTGKHFAIGIANTNGFNSDYQLFNTSGGGGNVGLLASTSYETLADWQVATGSPDANSIYGSAGFVNATGGADIVDLHIDLSIPSIVESKGLSLAIDLGDYDGDIRYGEFSYSDSGTAPDIGADEGEFYSKTAYTYTWKGAESSNWDNPNNWDSNGGTYPNYKDDIVIIDESFSPLYCPVIADAATYSVKNITIDTNATLTIGEGVSGQLNIFDTITVAGNVVCGYGSYVNYISNEAQVIAALNYHNLLISGARTTNDITLSNTDTIGIAGNFVNTAVFTTGGFVTIGSTINFNGTGNQDITAQVSDDFYQNLVLSKGGIKILKTASTINGNLFIAENVTLIDGGYLLSGPGLASGTFTIEDNAVFTMTNNNTTSGTGNNASSFPLFKNYDFATTSTVSYAGNTAQDIFAVPADGYGNLVLANNTKTTDGSFDVQGDLTVGASTTLYYGSNTITVKGNISNSNVINGSAGDPDTGKILIASGLTNRTILATINNTTFGNIEIDADSSTTTLYNSAATGNTLISGYLKINNGTLEIGEFKGTNAALIINDSIVIAGTLTHKSATGIKNYNGNFVVKDGGTFSSDALAGNVNFSKNIVNDGNFDASSATGTYTLMGSVKTIGGSKATSFGVLSVSVGTEILSGVTLNVNSTFTVTAPLTNSGILNSLAVSAIAGAGSITNNGVFSLSNASIAGTLIPSVDENTVIYTGAVAQTIKMPTTNPYYNLTIDKSAGIATMGGNFTVSGDLTIENGSLATSTYTLTGAGSSSGKTLTINNEATFTIQTAIANPMPTFENYALSFNSTVEYKSNYSNNVLGLDYGNLTLSIASGTTQHIRTLVGNASVAGNLSINNYNNFMVGEKTLTLGNTSALSGLSGQIVMGASSTKITGAGNGANLVFVDNAAKDAIVCNLPLINDGIDTLTIDRASGIRLSGNNNVNKLYMLNGLLDIYGKSLILGSSIVNSVTPAKLCSTNNTGTINFAGGTGDIGTLYIKDGTIISQIIFSKSGIAPIVTVEGDFTLAGNAEAFSFKGENGVFNINGNMTISSNTAKAFTMTGTGVTLNMNGDLTLGATTLAVFDWTDGMINMGNNTFYFNSTAANLPSATQTKYISFSGSDGGFQWNMPNSTAAGTYKLPIGVSGDVNGFRPVSIQLNAANPASIVSLKVGYDKHTNIGVASATEVPLVGNNRAGYIAKITRGVNDFTVAPNIIMTYQDDDFNDGAPDSDEVAIYKYSGSGWSRVGNNGVDSADDNVTILKNDISLSTNTESYVLGVSGGLSLPASIYRWTGVTSNEWNEPTNWEINNGTYPNDPGDNVVIDDTFSPSNWPTISNGATYTVKNISVSNGAVLTIGAGTSGQLDVYGNFVNNATVNGANGSTVRFMSASTQTIPAANYFNLTCNGSTGDRILSPIGTIGVAGTLTLGTNNYITTSSTINFNGSGNQTIPTQPTIGFYNNLMVSTGGTKTIQVTTNINGNLTINSGAILADGASAIIVGPDSSSGKTFTIDDNGTFTSVNTSTAINSTNIGPFPLFETNDFDENSTINFNAAAATPIPAISYGNLSLSGSSVTKTAQGNIIVNGNFANYNSVTFNLGSSNTHTFNGNLTNTGTIANATSPNQSNIVFEGSGNTNLPAITNGIANLTINRSGGIVSMTGINTIFGALSLTDGILAINGQILTIDGTVASGGSGTISGTTASSLTINGSGDVGELNFTSGAQTLLNLTINRSSGSVVLGTNLAIGTATTGTLTLTNGILDMGSNVLTIANTNANGVTVGLSNSFVKGALARTLPASLASGTTYHFPIGKNAYQLMSFNNLVSSGSVVVTAEVFDENSNGTGGLGISNFGNRYWTATVSGTGSMTEVGSVSLTETGLVSGTSVIGQSLTKTGIYLNKNGSVSANIITSQSMINPSLGYFAIGEKVVFDLCPGPYTIGPTGNFNTLAEVADILNGTTVSCNLLFELQSKYTEYASTPIVFENINNGTNTITIRPIDGASNLLTSGDPGTGSPLINLKGVSNIILDGRSGGTGSDINWTISNARTATTVGPAVQMQSGVSNTRLQYLQLESQNTTATSGTVFITANATPAVTNSNITIQNCNVTSLPTGTMANGIYAYGNASTQFNHNINILNNKIFNFTSKGIGLDGTGSATQGYGNEWNISENSIYNTQTTAVAIRGISINTGNGHSITDNFIGGQAANCVGLPMTNSGNVAFNGIYLSVGTNSATIVDNNTISNISMTGTAGSSFIGINLAAGLCQVGTTNGNIIGSIASVNSIQVAGTSTTVGIAASSTSAISIAKNTIANMAATGTAAGSMVRGIAVSSSGVYTISANTVRNLSTSGIGTGTGTSSSVVGISYAATGVGATIEKNTVFALSNTAASANVVVTGIAYTGATSGTNIVNANFVHSFSTSSSSSISQQVGIAAVNGLTTYSNNMIRLGIDAQGNAQTITPIIAGISKASTNNMKFYHNSVYIGGSGVGTGTANTYAFNRTAAGIDDVRNNIFVNARSNSSTGGKHYAVSYNNNTNLTSNNNIYYTNGTGGYIGSYNGGTTEQPTLQGLMLASGNQENASGFGNPNFVNPTSAIPDLHVQGITPAESAGAVIAEVTNDFDGENRGYYTPVDIGADAGNYTSLDIYNPLVSVPAIPSQAMCGEELSIEVIATIIDVGTSGIASGSLAPKLWWRLSGGTWTSIAHSSVSGNEYVFLLEISSVNPGEIYEYYVVAQDQASTPNFGYSHFNATTPLHSSVNNITTANAVPATFSINSSAPLSGVVTVGSGGDYSSFNGASGLFSAINNNGLKGDLTVQVISNITETATTNLNAISNYCGVGPFTVTIEPSSASVKTISGNLSGDGLLVFNGANDVVIDGQYNDDNGQYLKFINTNSNANTILIQNGTTNLAIKNCIIEGQASSTTKGIINIGGGASNSYIIIDNNLIGSANWASNCIYSAGNSSDPNHHITISNNEIFNFLIWSGGATRAYGINITNNGNGSNWEIVGNSIYNKGVNGQNTQTALGFTPGAASNDNVISGNWIGGSSKECGTGGNVSYWGNSWNNSSYYYTEENQVIGIDVNCGTIEIDSNKITNIFISNLDYSGFIGVNIKGSTQASVTYNKFGSGSNGQPDNSKIIQVSGGAASYYAPGYIYGIWNQSNSTSMTTYDHNYFYYLFQSGSYEGGNVHCIAHQAKGPATITRNLINGPQAAGLYYNSFGIRLEPTASTSGNVISGNSIAGPYINGYDPYSDEPANFGIYVKVLGTQKVSGVISDNIVWDMRNADIAGFTEGIYIWSNTGGNGDWDIYNNQITLLNNGNTSNCVGLYGIDIQLNSASTTNVYNNTVFIGGSNGGSSLATHESSSYAFFRMPGASGNVVGDKITLKNNIFINTRLFSNALINGHFAIANYGSSNYATNWDESNYNFLLTGDGSKSYLGLWGTSIASTFSDWKSKSKKEANSWSVAYTDKASTASALNPSDLFVNLLNNLSINTANQASWFVNGKGVALSDVPNDFFGNPRSNIYGFGTDIGAHEFTPDNGVLPHELIATPSKGGTNTFNFAGRDIAAITWGYTGTVPSSIALRYYSGDDPVNNFPANVAKTNWYMNIIPTGGSDYTYDVDFSYDNALLGSMLSPSVNLSEMIVAKTEMGSWKDVENSTVDLSSNTLSAKGLTMFSDFTGKDGDSPLPVSLLYFVSDCYKEGITLSWATASEINNDYFTIERSEDGYTWASIAQIKGSGTNNSLKTYSYKDVTASPYVQYFYRLKQTDYDGTNVLLSTIAQSCEELDSGFEIITAFQNDNILNIHYKVPNDDNIVVELIDMLGKVVYADKVYANKGHASHTIDVNAMANNSVYMIRLTNKNESVYRRHFIAH